jgi:DNA-binding NarL/FixJ family response regulator
VHVIGLSMFEEEHVIQAMIQSGAKAFVSKAASTSELLETIYAAVRGK